MNVVWMLTKRNIKLFIRDKAGVFFSLFMVFVLIILFYMFLGEVLTNGIKENFIGRGLEVPNGIEIYVSSSMVAAYVVFISFSVPVTALGRMAEDAEKKNAKDFLAAPIRRSQIIFGYLLSTLIISMIFSMLMFLIGEIYIVTIGGELIKFVDFIFVVSIILLTILSFSSVLLFIMTFVRSRTVSGALNGIGGAFVGFVAGIYVPLSILGDDIKNIVMILPPIHSTTLLKNIICKNSFDNVFGELTRVNVETFKEELGLSIRIFDHSINPAKMIMVLVVYTIIFSILSIIRLKKIKL